MTPATKQEALRKLTAIRNKIGYPNTWRDYSALPITPTGYFDNVLSALVFEKRSSNGTSLASRLISMSGA